jgi:drug/metabolite transporter (DMT)-like permease
MPHFINQHLGEFVSLFVTLCWTFTSLAFESAGKKVGSLSVNIIRLVMALFLIGMLSWFRKGMFLPLDATGEAWFWLSVSGLIGFVFGDILLFQALIEIGARVSMLIMALAPLFAAVFGFFILGEQLTVFHLLGMLITLAGIAIVILSRDNEKGRVKVRYPVKGLLLALGGALGQGLGLVISKLGMHDYDPFLSTQIRIIAAIVGFLIMVALTNHWYKLASALANKQAMTRISVGAFFGPFLGVSFSLLAIQHTTTGVASTIMAMVPVFILIPTAIRGHEKITFREVAGAAIAVGGVVMLFV